MKIHAQAYIENTEGTSRKCYFARVVEDPPGHFTVPCLFGPIGAAKPQSTQKYDGTSLSAAEAAFEKVIREKTSKGYVSRPVPPSLAGGHPGVAPAASAPSAPMPAPMPAPRTIAPPKEDATGVPRFGAQLAGDRGHVALEAAVGDPARFAVEEKLDGFRALITFTPDGLIAIRNRHGEDKGRIASAPFLEAHLRTLGSQMPDLWGGSVLDGELVGKDWSDTAHLLGGGGRTDHSLRFVAFDLPWFGGQDLRAKPWSARRASLELVLASCGAGPIAISTLLVPAPDLDARVFAKGGEGLIIKDRHAPYMPGDRRTWAKIKQVRTAEAVVIDLEPGRGKYAGMLGALVLGQYRDGALVEVTRVSGMTDAERAGMDEHWLGRVVEFAYQDRTDRSYRHPRYLRERPDKAATDCSWAGDRID